ncbi:MAG TPA: 23S rRNA (uracil(1939)-C(5))-methyltransferase RlmD [Chlamydiales bacterium]|nr:23S rRNA (uracil(1939)-C(5))-methyltransferase RlmD [Chlamydiales bacterium]
MTEEIIIETLSRKAEGQAEYHNAKVLIPHTIPGDKVLAKLYKKRKGIIKGRLEQILIPSKDRVELRCPHAEICGGCMIQAMDYQKQLQQKEKWVLDQFQSHIFEDHGEIYPIVSLEIPWEFRNKMEFSFSQNGIGTKYLGLMIAKANRFVFNLSNCFLASSFFAKLVVRVREFWENSDYTAYNYENDTGLFLTLTVREGKNTSEKMVVLTINGKEEFAVNDQALFIKAVQEVIGNNPEKVSIILRKRIIEEKSPTSFEEIVLFGKDTIQEVLNIQVDDQKIPLTFNISATSFFQPSTCQAEKLYSTALSLLQDMAPIDVAYDLYSGTGTLAMIFSKAAKNVIGIELNPDAVEDAKKNALQNGIENVQFIAGDVGKILQSTSLPKPDLVIVDPPRAGLDDLAIAKLLQLMPEKIIYISCNVLTQEKNYLELKKAGYKIKKMIPLDQFPHTYHIENIALLER